MTHARGSGIASLDLEGLRARRLLDLLEQPLQGDDRSKAIQALRVAAEVIGAIGNEQKSGYELQHPVVEQLYIVIDAIDDRRHGVLDPILQGPRFGGRVSSSRHAREARSAVALVRAMQKKGIKLVEARRIVAAEFSIKPGRLESWLKGRLPRGDK